MKIKQELSEQERAWGKLFMVKRTVSEDGVGNFKFNELSSNRRKG